MLSNITTGMGSDPFPDNCPSTESSDSKEYSLSGKLGQSFEKNNFENKENKSQSVSQFPSCDEKTHSNLDREGDTELGKEVGFYLGHGDQDCPSCSTDDIENHSGKEKVKEHNSTYTEKQGDCEGVKGDNTIDSGSESNYPLPSPLTIKYEGNFGITTGLVTPLKLIKKGTCLVCEIKFTYPDGSTETRKFKNNDGRKQLEAGLKKISDEWETQILANPNQLWDVRQMGEVTKELDYVWVKNCKLTKIANPPTEQWYFFESPSGEFLKAAGISEFKLAEVEAQ